MIRLHIEFEENSLLMDLPTDELFDHLGSIGILENISIGGTDKIKVERFPNDEKISEIICQRLLPSDKISDVNRLCERLDGQWLISDAELENALTENDVRGAENICEAFDELKLKAKQEIQEMKM